MLMTRLLLILFLYLSVNVNVSAQWFDAKGRASVVNNDKDIARNMAVQDALQHALLYTGAQVNSISQPSMISSLTKIGRASCRERV